ncbi:MAG: pyridoxal phosphate-dependent aminotransferase [Bacteroidota bacterium]|nr:pyridoxal phosphate-dependent aminotransferase [Rhodothermia bacterium]MCS7154693.1 pyridoxal phosphate-dependent aminotransferase [Bacteroidota bacterium]MDW8137486.1 pyridoxal phosphate-dependent aminotransferase [Bacteroidota bacterium]MDW8285560.1 pyridoxal phosphate-dependent aminotransferase [Bacteroidota bacterium]
MSIQLAPIAERVQRLTPSQTLAMTHRAMELKRRGEPIISLSAGEPDFDTPDHIREAAIEAIRAGFTHYTPNPGIPELREAIARKLARENGLHYEPDQILCSSGAKQSLVLAILALVNPGEEVLIPAPYWTTYPEMVKLAGGIPVYLQTGPERRFKITASQLEAAITTRTRLLLLCSPSNPSGMIYTEAELNALAEVLRRHERVWVLSDEIYEHLAYELPHVSIASLPGMQERTIVVNGFSKAYAMTGWRLGYAAGPRPVIEAMENLQGQMTSAPNSIAQKAGVAALEGPQEPVRRMREAFRARRDFLHEALSQIPGLVCPRPEGAFYLFPDVSAYFGRRAPDGRRIETAQDLCLYLLERQLVALVPGEAFGDPRCVRFSYAASMPDLEEAARRIASGLSALH